MGCNRWHNIRRYFKVSNIYEEASLDIKHADWWKKVDSLITKFRERCREAFTSGRDCAIDELLFQCHDRSSHTFQIPSKAASRDYKAYGLNSHGYLYNFVFTSRSQKIAEIGKLPGERQTAIMIKHLMHHLLERGRHHIVYLDNFFTIGELLVNLKHEEIGAYETIKAGSGISKLLVDLKNTLTKQD
jgi:hypothetical protein